MVKKFNLKFYLKIILIKIKQDSKIAFPIVKTIPRSKSSAANGIFKARRPNTYKSWFNKIIAQKIPISFYSI